jgi:hypothetical protein
MLQLHEIELLVGELDPYRGDASASPELRA